MACKIKLLEQAFIMIRNTPQPKQAEVSCVPVMPKRKQVNLRLKSEVFFFSIKLANI